MEKPSVTGRLTLKESAAVLSRLERATITAAQVRSVLVVDTRGRAMRPLRRGEPRLYDAFDLAAFRLTFRLRAAGVSPTVARVIVEQLRDLLAVHLVHRDPIALAVVGMKGLLVYASKTRLEHVVAWVPLPDVWSGVESAIAAVREAEPHVRVWSDPASALSGG